MDDSLNRSFDIGDAERSKIEEIAAVPNLDSIKSCSCRGACMRERGNNACPCKSVGQYCSRACHQNDIFNTCWNRKQYQESDTDSEGSEVCSL